MQGGKLKAKVEIRVATVFRNAPEPFLRMIVVHELAHLKEKEHNKAFYQLCCHMEPQYHQLELTLTVANAVVAWAGQNLKMMSGVIFSFFSA